MAEIPKSNCQRRKISDSCQQETQQPKRAKDSIEENINIEQLTNPVGDELKDQENKECQINNDQNKDCDINTSDLPSGSNKNNTETLENNESLQKKHSDKQDNTSSQLSSNDELQSDNDIAPSTISFTSTDGFHQKTIEIKCKNDSLVEESDASNAVQCKTEKAPQPEINEEIVAGPESSNSAHSTFRSHFSTSTPKSAPTLQQSNVTNTHASVPPDTSRQSLALSSTINCSNFSNNTNNTNNSYLSLFDNTNLSAPPPTLKKKDTLPTMQNFDFNDNDSFAVRCLDFEDLTSPSDLNVGITNRLPTNEPPRLGLNSTDTTLSFRDNSFFTTQQDIDARDKRFDKALETVGRHTTMEEIGDPFNRELCRAFLTKLNFLTVDGYTNAPYMIAQAPLPEITDVRYLNPYPGVEFLIHGEIGRGSYGSVYKATDLSTGKIMALKLQKSNNAWEIYICDQISKRIKSVHILPGLMTISTAIIAPNATLIASEFSPFGTLLDIINKLHEATKKVMHESLVMHFSAQICDIISHLHRNQIIHADIKPDNFLLMRVPSTTFEFPSIRLIDFGLAIDMTLFPRGNDTKFRKVIRTNGFTCIEMLEGRTWSYETDLFCVAATVHAMLFSEYMKLQKRGNLWYIKRKLSCHMNKHIWSYFFGNLLNIKPGGKELPDLNVMCRQFQEWSLRMEPELQKHIEILSSLFLSLQQ